MIEVTGAPAKIEKGSTFEVTGRGPLGLKGTTTFRVEELEDLHEIKMHCQRSGYYAHWVLTEARGNTFAERRDGRRAGRRSQGRVTGAMHTKRYLRRALDQTVDGLRRALGRS